MIDLHTHTIFSDGELIPAELARRAENKGLKFLGITDHGDLSNIDFIIPRIILVSEELNKVLKIKILPGIEITHVPPSQISKIVEMSRALGAKLIVVHGETIMEPVATGTNHAALNSDIDVLAHPGQISEEDIKLAKKKGICLEISGRIGHSFSNGYVAKHAKKIGAKLVIGSDAHHPNDIIDETFSRQIVYGAGLTENDFNNMQKNAKKIIND